MWKRKEDEKPLVPEPPQPEPPPVRESSQIEAPREESRQDLARTIRAEMARIGKTLKIKGELSGREDLFVDGEVEGSIDLAGHLLTVGPNGRVRTNIQAQSVIAFGRIEGNVRGSERVELRKSAVVSGDIVTQRIMIEDGAFLKGGIDIQKPDSKSEPRRDFAAAAPPPPATVNLGNPIAAPRREMATAPTSTPAASAGTQVPLPDQD